MPDDVPSSVRRIALPVASPYRRIPFALPRLARREGASLVHVQYFVAPRVKIPAVVTVHDLSFTRRPELFRLRDRMLLGGLGARLAAARPARDRRLGVHARGPDRSLRARPRACRRHPKRRRRALPARSRRPRPRRVRGSAWNGRSCSSSARCSRARTPRRCSRPSRACEATTMSSSCSPAATAAGSPRCASASASSLSATACACSGTSPRRRCPASTRPPSCSPSRRCTRGSGCRRSRRWRAAPRSARA